jgi:hypothetical protein
VIWVAAGSAVIAVTLMTLAVFTPRQDPPLRFRLYIRALEPGQNGVRGWWWEVHDEGRLTGGEVVVSGCSPYWERALQEGLAYRASAEQGYAWREAA